MASLADLVPIPSRDVMNIGLTSAREDTMLAQLGAPGKLTPDCSPPSPAIATRMVSGVNVGPFRVSGLALAVESLKLVFAAVQARSPEVHEAVKTAGMLCVRARRHNPAHFSNHSWGTAIDLYFGTRVVPQGRPLCQRGFLDLYAAFNANGWYWGAEFSGDSVDSMHFEVAQETILKWGAATAGFIAAQAAPPEPPKRKRSPGKTRRDRST